MAKYLTSEESITCSKCNATFNMERESKPMKVKLHNPHRDSFIELDAHGCPGCKNTFWMCDEEMVING